MKCDYTGNIDVGRLPWLPGNIDVGDYPGNIDDGRSLGDYLGNIGVGTLPRLYRCRGTRTTQVI